MNDNFYFGPTCPKFILFNDGTVIGVFDSLGRAQENAGGRKNPSIQEWIGLRHISTYVLAGWVKTTI